jgi:maleate cis-trans isomerase
MHGQVGFGDHHDTAHTMRIEFMEDLLDHCGFGLPSRVHEELRDDFFVVKNLPITVVKFDQKMCAQSVQSVSISVSCVYLKKV